MASSTIFGSCSPGVIFRPSLINPPCPALSSISCVCGGRRVVRLRAEVKSNKAISEGSEQKWVAKGVITESLPNGMFWVRLENGDVVLGYISGKIRRNSIRMLAGDKVKIEVSRYDSTRGRIVYRMPNRDS